MRNSKRRRNAKLELMLKPRELGKVIRDDVLHGDILPPEPEQTFVLRNEYGEITDAAWRMPRMNSPAAYGRACVEIAVTKGKLSW